MMIQDIGNHIFHNEFDNKEVTEDDIVFVFYGNQILCKEKKKKLCLHFI